MISKELEKHILDRTKAHSIGKSTVIQELWSGYGEIIRVQLKGGRYNSIIIKEIAFPNENNHPRGWNTSASHERKVKSYEVEQAWYADWNKNLNDHCKTAQCIGMFSIGEQQILLLEDLNALGYDERRQDLSIEETKLCLHWLANFHALHMNKPPTDLWETGCYWHLSTRKEEWERMEEGALKHNAQTIDSVLNSCQHQTIVHGDAKVANFCFTKEMDKTAAVDFQYVGRGCGMKDVIYLFSSCLTANELEQYDHELLDYYFQQLQEALNAHCTDADSNTKVDFKALEEEWRSLYSIAWADFIRFLQGWSPTHYKLNKYSLKQVEHALEELN